MAARIAAWTLHPLRLGMIGLSRSPQTRQEFSKPLLALCTASPGTRTTQNREEGKNKNTEDTQRGEPHATLMTTNDGYIIRTLLLVPPAVAA